MRQHAYNVEPDLRYEACPCCVADGMMAVINDGVGFPLVC
jgi:hypothetical protein